MIGRVLALVALGAVTLTAAPAYSEDEDPSVYSESRKYFSLIGQASIQTLPNDKIGSGTRKGEIQGVSSSGAGGGFAIIAGIRTNAWVGFEAEYEFLVGPKLSGCTVRDDRVAGEAFDAALACPADNPNENDGEIRDDDVYFLNNGWIQAKIFPLHAVLDKRLEGRLQPYIKLGGGVMIASNLGTKTPIAFAGRFGLGADYHMNETWSVGLDVGYMVPSQNLSGLNPLTIGLGATVHWY